MKTKEYHDSTDIWQVINLISAAANQSEFD